MFVRFHLALFTCCHVINLLYAFSGAGLFYLRYAACEIGLRFHTISRLFKACGTMLIKACVAHMQCQYTYVVQCMQLNPIHRVGNSLKKHVLKYNA